MVKCSTCGSEVGGKKMSELHRFVEVNCQVANCKNKVKIIEGNAYFGILCPEHSKTSSYSNKRFGG